MQDVTEGTTLPDWVLDDVPVEKMKTMALLLRDPNPIHWDVEAVKRLGMGDRVINQGPNNMAYVINMLIDWTGDPNALHAIKVRFMANVFAGDRLVAGGVVTGVREEDDTLFADCEVWLDRNGEERALSGTATVRLP